MVNLLAAVLLLGLPSLHEGGGDIALHCASRGRPSFSIRVFLDQGVWRDPDGVDHPIVAVDGDTIVLRRDRGTARGRIEELLDRRSLGVIDRVYPTVGDVVTTTYDCSLGGAER